MRKNGKEAGVGQPRAKASDLARREIANLPEDDIDQFGGIIMTDKALAEQISRTRRNGSKPNPSEDDLFFDIDEEWMERQVCDDDNGSLNGDDDDDDDDNDIRLGRPNPIRHNSGSCRWR